MIENLKKYSLGGNWVRVNGALTWNPKMEEDVFGEYYKVSDVDEALRSTSPNTQKATIDLSDVRNALELYCDITQGQINYVMDAMEKIAHGS